MIRRYKLPEAIAALIKGIDGSGEFEAIEFWGGPAGGRPEYLIKGSGISILMPEGIPLEPIQAEEPAPGTYFINDVVCVRVQEDDEVPWCTPTIQERHGTWHSWDWIIMHFGPDLSIVRAVGEEAK